MLGEDDWGVWISVPAGTRRWKGADSSMGPTRMPAVFCAPRDGWWHLHYNGDTTKLSHFVDIVTPPSWVSDDRYEMIDLDLDVVRHQSGLVEVEDEDEFEVHRIQYGYTPEMIRRAEEETQRIVGELQSRHEPFFETAASWLAQVE